MAWVLRMACYDVEPEVLMTVTVSVPLVGLVPPVVSSKLAVIVVPSGLTANGYVVGFGGTTGSRTGEFRSLRWSVT